MSEGVREGFWLQGTMGGSTGQLDRIQRFSETDFTENLNRSISQSSSPWQRGPIVPVRVSTRTQ